MTNTVTPQRIEPVRSELFASFADAPPAWREICGDDLAMDLGTLGVYQRTLADQCRCWGVMIYDAAGLAIGCAALCLFQTELIQSSNPAVLRWRDRLQRLWPGFGRMRILFCGLSLPAGSTHVRVRPGACAESVFAGVDDAMQRLAREVKCKLTIFKELKRDSALAATLAARGYVGSPLPPLHVLRRPFADFAGYRDALKSRYRAQVLRSLKKLVEAGFEVLNGCGPDFFAAHLDDAAHQLYVEVQKRAEHKLELMPASFFHGMAKALGDDALLTVIRREGKLCAFTFAFMRGGAHYNTYSGLDYALNNEGDLYFNLFYHNMDQAFRAGATSLYLGQTSDAFKSRLGSATENLWYFARAWPPALNTVLRLTAPLASPKVIPVTPHDVFSHSPRR